MAEKMSLIRVLLPALGSGTALGAAFYVLGAVANPIIPAVTAAGFAVVGFASGFTVGLSSSW